MIFSCRRRSAKRLYLQFEIDASLFHVPSTNLRILAHHFPGRGSTGDPRFSGIDAGCYMVIGYDKRQKTPRLVDVYDVLCIEILKLLTETQL